MPDKPSHGSHEFGCAVELKDIGVRAAIEYVLAIPANETIIAGAAVKPVGIQSALKSIGAIVASESIGASLTVEIVSEGAAVENVVAFAAKEIVDAAVAVKGVDACRTDDPVPLGIAVGRVGGARIELGVAEEKLLDVARHAVGRKLGIDRVPTLAGVFGDPVPEGDVVSVVILTTHQDVAAGAPEDIVPRATEQGIDAASGYQVVVALAAIEAVVETVTLISSSPLPPMAFSI